MAYRELVNDRLMAPLPSGNQLTSAAIIGHDGIAWAKSSDFPQVNPAEVKTLLKERGHAETLMQNGLVVGGEHYSVKEAMKDGLIKATKDGGGFCVRITTLTVVFGFYSDPCTEEECSTIVAYIGNYLADSSM